MKRPLYRLRIPNDVARLIRGLHPQLTRKVRAALEQILTGPHSGKALKDDLEGLWSYRLGKFRLIYRLGTARTIELVAIGPRERIYEETYRRVRRGESEE